MTFISTGQWRAHDDEGRRKYLSADERARFLAAADLTSPSTRALCYLLAYTGCRVSELLSLTRDRLDCSPAAVRFQTLKRRKIVFRTVPIPEGVAELLMALKTVEGRFWPLHRSSAWRRIKAVMDGAGIAGPMACCRGLRHGFGIRAATGSVPPNLIQRWMGHASSDTTAIYLDAVGQEEREFAKRMW